MPSEELPTEDEIRAELDAAGVARRRPDQRMTSMGAGSDDLEPGRAYLAATVAGGWAVPTWPRAHGGRDASAAEAAAIAGVQREFAVPDLYAYTIGLGMAGPSLLAHGTTEQQDRWLRPIADGSEIWCQMFSEPEAGSDLANVALRAERDGEVWRLDGQKVWTSRAVWARWSLCLARTDAEVPKHKGLTMFVVDMEAPGVEVRPLVQMNGDQHFSEVFLSGVEVPDSYRLGDPGSGWNVAMTVLAHERALAGDSRGGADGQSRGQRAPRWLTDVAARGVLADPVWRDRALHAYEVGEVARLTGARTAAATAAGKAPGPAGSGAKLRKVDQYKAQAYLAKDARGAEGMLDDHDGQIEFMTAPSMSIRGGTDEIQRNILGERVLGLPGEPRVDRDVPWSRARKGVL